MYYISLLLPNIILLHMFKSLEVENVKYYFLYCVIIFYIEIVVQTRYMIDLTLTAFLCRKFLYL